MLKEKEREDRKGRRGKWRVSELCIIMENRLEADLPFL